MTADVDVLAPCALGGVLNDDTVPALRCRAIAGAANNQLADDALAPRCAARGILWAPDFVCNAGGIINICRRARARGLRRAERADTRVRAVGDTLRHDLRRAPTRGGRRPPRRWIGRPARRDLAGRRRGSLSRRRGAAGASARLSAPSLGASFSRCARSVSAANGRTPPARRPRRRRAARPRRAAPASSAASSLRSRSARWARYSSSLAAGSPTASPWPGQSTSRSERAQAPQPVEVLAQPAGDEHAALAEHGVAGERGAAGDEHEVVVGVAGDGEHARAGRTCRRRAVRGRPAGRRAARAARATPSAWSAWSCVSAIPPAPPRAATSAATASRCASSAGPDRRPTPGRGRRPTCSCPTSVSGLGLGARTRDVEPSITATSR